MPDKTIMNGVLVIYTVALLCIRFGSGFWDWPGGFLLADAMLCIPLAYLYGGAEYDE